MSDSGSEAFAMFDELPRPPITVRAERRSRGFLTDLIIEDGDRSFRDAVDLREEKKRKGVIQKLTSRWPDLKDDASRASHVLAELDRIASLQAPLKQEPAEAVWEDHDAETPKYFEKDGALFWNKPTTAGPVPVQLTNFAANIACEITCDDGVTKSKYFEIECRVSAVAHKIRISVEEFGRMSWPIEQLGVEAVVFAGMGTKDHVRTAIQMLSTSVTQRTIFRHLGWTTIDGSPAFLHAGGAIGATNVEVEVESQLSNFVLPVAPTGADLLDAIQASLGFLSVAKSEITAPILSAIYRSVIPVPTDFSMWVHGPSGVMKSELAALAQQHFGAGMDRTHLPASWSSTANFNEKIAFLAKDAFLVVDDFAPQPGNVDRLHRDAERLLRSQGNRSGRGRMTQSASLTVAQPPRGLILGTGEDVPRGHSLRGRLFAVAIGKGDIDLSVLTALQAQAADGAFARSMAGFLDWLRGRVDRPERLFEDFRQQVRRLLRSNGHARNPDQVAHLMFGADALLVFAFDTGAISRDDFLSHRHSIWNALVDVAREQIDLQIGEDPAIQFLSLLNAAIVSGSVFIEPAPHSPQSSGGEIDSLTSSSTPRIGWKDVEGVYLESNATLAAIQSLARKQGTELPISLGSLRKRLYDANLLLAVERDGDGKVVHYEPKKQFGTRRIRVLHLRADFADYAEKLGRVGRVGREEVPAAPPIPGFAPVSELLGRELGRTGSPPDRHPASEDEPSSFDPPINEFEFDKYGWTQDPDDDSDPSEAEGAAP